MIIAVDFDGTISWVNTRLLTENNRMRENR